MYAREDSPQPTTTRLAQTSDGMTLAAENVRMHERMAKELAKQPNRKTDKARRNLKRNLAWEMKHASISEEELLHRIKTFEGCDSIASTTLRDWVTGETGNIGIKYRKALASIFGYDDPRSITSDYHRKETQIARSKPIPKDEMEYGLTKLFKAAQQSLTGSNDIHETVDELLENPSLAPYARMMIHWLASYR